MIEEIAKRLEDSDINNFKISSKISKKSISLSANLEKLLIYIPGSCEDFQQDLCNYLRKQVPGIRIKSKIDRDVSVISLSKKLDKDQYYNLIRYIIDEVEFCTILEES